MGQNKKRKKKFKHTTLMLRLQYRNILMGISMTNTIENFKKTTKTRQLTIKSKGLVKRGGGILTATQTSLMSAERVAHVEECEIIWKKSINKIQVVCSSVVSITKHKWTIFACVTTILMTQIR